MIGHLMRALRLGLGRRLMSRVLHPEMVRHPPRRCTGGCVEYYQFPCEGQVHHQFRNQIGYPERVEGIVQVCKEIRLEPRCSLRIESYAQGASA